LLHSAATATTASRYPHRTRHDPGSSSPAPGHPLCWCGRDGLGLGNHHLMRCARSFPDGRPSTGPSRASSAGRVGNSPI
jgi:hypothetical protein